MHTLMPECCTVLHGSEGLRQDPSQDTRRRFQQYMPAASYGSRAVQQLGPARRRAQTLHFPTKHFHGIWDGGNDHTSGSQGSDNDGRAYTRQRTILSLKKSMWRVFIVQIEQLSNKLVLANHQSASRLYLMAGVP